MDLITTELEGVEANRAQQIRKWFEPMLNTLDAVEEEYKEIMEMPMSTEKASEARGLRLRISKIRIEARKEKDKRKKAYLIAGNAIQAVFNLVKHAVVDKETELSNIENYYENLEKQRIENLQSQRESLIAPYEEIPSSIDYGIMKEDAWKIYFDGVKLAYKAKIAAEKQAEQKRLDAEKADQELREAEHAENIRLKKEAEEHQREIDKIQKEADEREKKLQEENDKQKQMFEAEKSLNESSDELDKLLGFSAEKNIKSTLSQKVFDTLTESTDKQILLDIVEIIQDNMKKVKSDIAKNALLKARNTLSGTAMII